MPRKIAGACGRCLPVDRRQAQRLRERAELAAIAKGFRYPERAGELAVRGAWQLPEVQR